jgi:hypothetical protein
MSRQSVRIANCSGYLGDRFTALDEALAGDPVDVLFGDYLAEIARATVSADSPAESSRASRLCGIRRSTDGRPELSICRLWAPSSAAMTGLLGPNLFRYRGRRRCGLIGVDQ